MSITTGQPRKKIGFVVNPIAGMGGTVGLKGTDGPIAQEALRRGARPVAPRRGLEFLRELQRQGSQFGLLIAEGIMGGELAKELNLEHTPIDSIGYTTSNLDTIRVSAEMLNRGIDVLVFVGGDGTARDILEAIRDKVPVLGVPAGVKVYSSVFAVSPTAAATTITRFLSGQASTTLREVLDVDEGEYRKGQLSISLKGHLVTIDGSELLQNPKTPSQMTETDEMKAISDYVVEEAIDPNSIYVLGPGLTVQELARRIGFAEKTPLGVDVVKGDGTILAKDADESQILGSVQQGRTKIILSPIGGQGFLLGRGNQQISPKVLRKIGLQNLIVLSTRSKMDSLHPRRLIVDTGDRDLDTALRGYRRVIVGYREEMIVKVD